MQPFKSTYEKEDMPTVCPRCKGELITIDGNLVKWLTCSNCRWKKLAGKEEKVIKIMRIGESHEEPNVPKAPERLKVSFD